MLILAFPLKCLRAQYGLGFASHEVVLDQRTGLDLSAGRHICFREDIELSFDLSFMPNRFDYFGYVVRIISNDQTNIDLLYDRRHNAEKHFKIVLGEKFSKIAFDIDSNKLFNEWSRIKIKLDAITNKLTVSYGDSVFTEHIGFTGNQCLKVLFGYNNYQDFKTTDVPAMKIRDVQIRQGARLIHQWLLDEENGERIVDVVKGMTAVVNNPYWIKRQHHEWGLLQEIKIGGQASTAFDAKTESVYIVGRDSMVQIRVPTGLRSVLNYSSGPLRLINGNQSFFDTVRNQLLNICIDQQKVSNFDFQSLSWSDNFTYPGVGTSYLHFNKFHSQADSSLYFVGGYGHFFFKSEIQRYNLVTGNWHEVKHGGDQFIPRYLSALGATAKGAYIVGGYGSITGQQMLSPKNLYDLVFFDKQTKAFSKRYELDPGQDDFVWANSLIVDEPDNRYYGLTFPKHKYHSGLQLVAGSLTQPGLDKFGGEIPYLFHDIRSFSDLFYCPDSRRFVAVTLYHDERDITTAKIYSLYSPPLPHRAVIVPLQQKRLIYYIGFTLVLSIGLYFFVRAKRRRRHNTSGAKQPTVLVKQEYTRPSTVAEIQRPKDSIFLFGGDLQLFDADGTDITRNFTPLIKELFLVVLLHTIRWGRGISSEKLTEQFWFDKSAESARNNRSVNIAKINTILEKIGRAKISKETGYWRFGAADDVYIDYQNYLAIVTNKSVLDKGRIKELSAIVHRGGFLSETDYEWLDSFKADVSIQVINTYMRFAENVAIADDPEFMVELANYIFYFDPVHEEAMIIKCKALAQMGNHSLATQTFENFRNEYRQIYGEDFGKDYKTVLS